MRKNSPNYLSTIEVLRKIEHFKGMKDSELDEILEKCTKICQHGSIHLTV